MNILLIYPEFPDTFWSFKHALKFVHKKSSSPPLGLLTIAAMLPGTWEKRLVDMNVQRLHEKDLAWADMIMISAMTVQRESANDLIQRARAAQKVIVAGGPLFTAEPEEFPEVDHLILNEAEITLPLFLSDLGRGKPQRIYQTDEYADIAKTPVPLWELIDLRHYDSLSIQFTRGCPFNCDFCNVTALLGHRMRMKTTDQLIGELDKIYDLGWRRGIFIVDDNFIGNKRIHLGDNVRFTIDIITGIDIADAPLPQHPLVKLRADGCLEQTNHGCDDAALLDEINHPIENAFVVTVETDNKTAHHL